jgi:hypothetical protein
MCVREQEEEQVNCTMNTLMRTLQTMHKYHTKRRQDHAKAHPKKKSKRASNNDNKDADAGQTSNLHKSILRKMNTHRQIREK